MSRRTDNEWGIDLAVRLPDRQRKQRLEEAVRSEVALGARVEAQAGFHAIVVRGRPVNHILHLILTCATCGFWLTPWVLLGLFGGERRTMLEITENGHIARRRIGWYKRWM